MVYSTIEELLFPVPSSPAKEIAESLALRAPVPLVEHRSAQNLLQHDAVARPSMCVIHVACEVLQVSDSCRFTAACLYHRFILSGAPPVDKNGYPHNLGVAACLFLACKSSEEPRRLRDIINCAHMIHDSQPSPRAQPESKDNQSVDTSFSISIAQSARKPVHPEQISSAVKVRWNPTPPLLDNAYWETKERVVEIEQYVLRWLAFDTSVSSPHQAVGVILKEAVRLSDGDYHSSASSLEVNGSDGMTQISDLLESALGHVNQALFSVSMLTSPVMVLACSAVQQAAKDCGVKLVEGWTVRFGVQCGSGIIKQVTE